MSNSFEIIAREWFRDYFHHTEGRGKNCVVEAYRRGDLDYFFAYPEEYSQQSVEDVEAADERRKRLAGEVNAKQAKGTKAFLNVVAAREGISPQRLKQILKGASERARKPRLSAAL